MAQGSQAVGSRAFRRELDDHERRITEVEENGGGEGGPATNYEGHDEDGAFVEASGPLERVELGAGLILTEIEEGVAKIEAPPTLLDEFYVAGDNDEGHSVLVEEGETVNFGVLDFFANSAVPRQVLCHVYLSASAIAKDIQVGEKAMGLAAYDGDDEKIQDLMVVEPLILADKITPVVMDFVVRSDAFYGEDIVGEDGKVHWRIKPFWTNPEDSEESPLVVNDLSVTASLGPAGQRALSSFGTATLL